jgi:hypothetical protein
MNNCLHMIKHMQAADLSLTAKAKQRQHARNCMPFAVQARAEGCLRKRRSGSHIEVARFGGVRRAGQLRNQDVLIVYCDDGHRWD